MMWRDTGHPHARERGLGQILPLEFSEEANPVDTLTSGLEPWRFSIVWAPQLVVLWGQRPGKLTQPAREMVAFWTEAEVVVLRRGRQRCLKCRTSVCCVLSHFSGVWLFVTPWTVAHQAPLSLGILQARKLELSCPPPRDLPDPETELETLCLLLWQVGSFPLVPLGKPEEPVILSNW